MGRGPSPDRLGQMCRSTLDRNWREGDRDGFRYAYTAPSGQRYPWQMGARIGRAVAAAGLREYYDPFTGRGMGATDFSWSALVMELIDPDRTARSSHIPMQVVG